MADKRKQIFQYPWLVAACNLLLVLAVFSLSRLFFYWVNRDMFPAISNRHLAEMLLGGIRFDLTALLYLNSVYLLLLLLPIRFRENRIWQKVAWWFYMIPNAVGILLNSIDTIYVRYTDRRTTCTFFSEFQNDDNLGNIFIQSVIQYWYVTLFCVAMIILLAWISRKKVCTNTILPKWAYYCREIVIFLVSVYFIVIGIRGGFGAYTRPITISNALQYTNSPQETAIVLNTPFSLMKSLENEVYVNPHYFSEDELETIYTPIHQPESDSEIVPMNKQNVVVIILESFSKEFMGKYTPFLDSLVSVGLSFQYSYANGRKSIDAMPSILSSIPMLIEPYIVTPYSTNQVSSLADCLNKEGYTTAFFHGAPNGSMGFEAYAKSAGFQQYYGMDEYHNNADFDGTWAIWDEPFLQYYAATMNSLQEPFFTTVFTASSHHPFNVPEQYENVFPKGTMPLHQCVGYSDYALRKFFDTAKQQSWYEHTLFVLTADHTSQLSAENNNSRGLFEVPIIFFSPSCTLQNFNEQVAVSQIDIMPSVLAFLNYSKPYFAFGENVLNEEKVHPYVINYNNPMFQSITDSSVLQFDGSQFYGDGNEETKQFLKAFIQQYIYRITTNQMICQKNE